MCRDKNTIELHIRSWNWEKGGSMWERCAVPWEDMKMVTSPNLPIFQSPISQLFDQASYISRSICAPKHAKSEHFFCCRIWISGWGEVWSNFRVLTINCRSEPPISIPRRPCCALWGALYSFVGRTLPLYKYGREWKNFKTCSSWAGEKPASQFWANKVQEESPKISLRASKTGNKLEISLLLSAVSENPNVLT